MKAIEREFELTSAAVLATEDWAPSYANSPDQHAQLIKNTAKMERQIMVYFRDLSKKVDGFIDWYAYSRAIIEQRQSLKGSNIQAYDVNVIVNNDAVAQENQAFIKVVFDTVATTAAEGSTSAALEHGVPIGQNPTSTIIQQMTTKQLANLVGMSVNDNGMIVPNPNPEMDIDDTTRALINQSIKTSVSLGQSQQEAAAQLGQFIANPDRAELIARTEMVNAYQGGREAYALSSGATGKQWNSFGSIDICATNTGDGIIPIDQAHSSGDMKPTAHPRCMCNESYTYNSPVNRS